MVFILGKSESGKSTLLNLIGGIDKESSGEIIVDGKSMQTLPKKIIRSTAKIILGLSFRNSTF